ncbi:MULTISPECIES: hypothetical protein [Niastella]|uniref:Zinc-ribbon 15 domain-containing protein n=1 Tax=Niastella soli TaxID=2821487 RepID=A0ABS3Z472_9BACT|nr:hypothetical protein [Niastella soli]MBO9204950.1 hypothetical protein [Niastella soli]
MFVLKGTTEIIENVKDGEIIQNGCPQCRKDLLLKQFRVWNTIFLIPYLPSGDTRTVYECVGCYETFDPVYRNTYINRGKYLNPTRKEIKELTETFSLTFIASILTCDNRPMESVLALLKEFAIKYNIDEETHEEKFGADFLSQRELTKTVFELYDLFRDCFSEELINIVLAQNVEYSNLIDLSEKETKVLYTFSRHWGLTKSEFEELRKK